MRVAHAHAQLSRALVHASHKIDLLTATVGGGGWAELSARTMWMTFTLVGGGWISRNEDTLACPYSTGGGGGGEGKSCSGGMKECEEEYCPRNPVPCVESVLHRSGCSSQ